MSFISSNQSRQVRKEIRRIYSKNFIPVHSQDTIIKIGSLLENRQGETVRLDGLEIPAEYTKSVHSKFKTNKNLLSRKIKSASVLLAGEKIGPKKVEEDQTGLKYAFSNSKQMVMLLRGTHRTRLSNFPKFRNYVLENYTSGDLSPKVFVVDEVLESDQFFLQFGAESSGELGIMLDLPSAKYNPMAAEKAKITYASQNSIGFSVDGRDGGVLAYRVSSIKLLREKLNSRYLDRMSYERRDADVLEAISVADRKAIAKDEGFAFVDKTDAFLLEHEEMQD